MRFNNVAAFVPWSQIYTYTVTVVSAPNAGVNTSAMLCSDGPPPDLFSLIDGDPDAGGTITDLGLGMYQYVVEGSVRRHAQRVRINVQLVDVDTGEHLWAERFDANEDDIFSVQDQIVRSIAAQLSGRLQLASLEKASRKPPTGMAAYDYVLRGDALPVGIPEAEAEARQLFQKAVDLDPGYARAYAHLAQFTTYEWLRDVDAPVEMLDQSLELAKKAVALDDGDEFWCAV